MNKHEFTLTITDKKVPKEKHGINLGRLALLSGYSPSHISRVLSGKTTPSLKCMKKLAEVLEVNLSRLDYLLDKGVLYAETRPS